jgi:hypothetical protein
MRRQARVQIVFSFIKPLREGYRLIISPIPKIIEKHSYQLASALDFLLVGNSLANAVGGYLADVRVGSWRGCEGFRRR